MSRQMLALPLISLFFIGSFASAAVRSEPPSLKFDSKGQSATNAKIDKLIAEQNRLLEKYKRAGFDFSKSKPLTPFFGRLNLSQLEEFRSDTLRLSRIQLELLMITDDSNGNATLNDPRTLMELRLYFLEISDITLMNIEERQAAGQKR